MAVWMDVSGWRENGGEVKVVLGMDALLAIDSCEFLLTYDESRSIRPMRIRRATANGKNRLLDNVALLRSSAAHNWYFVSVLLLL